MNQSDPLPESIPTKITRLFGIRYPIVQGGMIWVSGWKLAAAVSKAGGLGLIGAGSMTPALLEEHIRKAQDAWDGPIGVNIPLMRPDAADLVDVTINSGIKIVFTSAGNPAKFTPLFHKRGIIVTHVAPSLKLALKAVEREVDAVVGEGAEAGGHNGYEEIPTFPLIPRLADHIEKPVIAAGGIRDGRGLAAALALGADGVQVGTRFAATIESSASEAYKQAVLDSKEPATVLTVKRVSPTRMLMGKFAQKAVEAEFSGIEKDQLVQILGKGRARRGLFMGDLEEGYMEAGEVACDIANVISAEEVVKSFIIDYLNTVRRLPVNG